MISLPLMAVILLMQPRMHMDILALKVHCSLLSHLLYAQTQRAFSAVLLASWSSQPGLLHGVVPVQWQNGHHICLA